MIDPMTGRFRALLAALVVILIAAAGAAYALTRADALRTAEGDDGSLTVATTGDVRQYINDSNAQAQLLDVAVNKLETSYYKPVDPQTPAHGETKALDDYLKAKHVSNVSLPNTENVAQILSFAQSHYGSHLGTNASTDLTETALRGVMDSVNDPYTVYLSPKEIQGLQESLSGGNFGGIGVYIYQLKDGQVIVQPIEDLPAARAGMKPGEVVDAVNGKPVKGMTLDRVEQLIRGPEGSIVQLRTHPYNRGGEHTFSITREVIHVPTVREKMEDGYDYIRLSDFGTTSADEVRKALVDGRAHGAKGYILDLRNNGGGLLDAAVKISSYFVPHGTIVATIDRQGNRSEEDALGTAIGGLQPLVILVNKYTASASEITSGALQDYHLAKLIGTKTFGKGVVQSIYPMPDAGALKITTARYVTPLGRDIQHKGIMPDIVVDQPVDPALIDTPNDKQLAVAKATLKQLAQQ